jgi:hypothetical protein
VNALDARRICESFACRSNDLSEPLAYPSTVDHRHAYRRDECPTWRSAGARRSQ